jgi:hypothetical protein
MVPTVASLQPSQATFFLYGAYFNIEIERERYWTTMTTSIYDKTMNGKLSNKTSETIYENIYSFEWILEK